MVKFKEFKNQIARLTILRELVDQSKKSANVNYLMLVLKHFEQRHSKPYVLSQMQHLEDVGAIDIDDIDGVKVARLRQRGQDHVDREIELPGVLVPSLDEEE